MRPTTNIPKIIFEDQDIIVLDKPAGLLVHLADSTPEKDTLVDYLLNNYPGIKAVGEDLSRPGIVHRLDKDTSGLMVIAKNQKTFVALKKQFQNRLVQKKYLALVFGVPKENRITIDMPIKRTAKGTYGARHAADVAKMSPELRLRYRPAQTTLNILQKYDGFALVEARPKTGRTHQIRVHLKAIGHPIVGDQIYSSVKQRLLATKKWRLGHQFLHAQELSFNHPRSEKKVTFESDLPADLKSIIRSLEK